MDTVTTSVLPYYYQGIPEDLNEKVSRMPPGLIGVATGFLGRYREFDACLQVLWQPPKAETIYYIGVDVTRHFNAMVEDTLKNPELQWLWILGDDHVFTQDLLLNLYERNVDIVVPLCLRKNKLPVPILEHPDPSKNTINAIRGKSGLIPYDGYTGNAGMLIRRAVLGTMEKPLFRAGQRDPGYASPDYFFCEYVKQYGITIHVDLDNHIGHMGHFAIWPRNEGGEWYVDYR